MRGYKIKKNAILIFTRTIYVLFVIETIISLFIVFSDIDNDIAFRFLIGYLFSTFFLLFYIPFITVLNLRKFNWFDIRKRLLKFIALFILFGVLNLGFDYFFRPLNINFYKAFSIALGLSFGISFIDVTFLKNK